MTASKLLRFYVPLWLCTLLIVCSSFFLIPHTASAAPSRLAGQDALSASTTTSVVATYPGATTAGNTLIASVYANVTTGLATISGWTKVGEQAFSGTAQSVAIWAKIATGSETTVTASGATGATIMRIHIYEYTGMAASVTVDGTAVGATSGVTNVTSLASGSYATANASDLLFIADATGGSSSAQAYTNSFNIRQVDASAIRLFDADQIVSSTGTYSTTASWTTSLRAGSILVALQGAASSPSVPSTHKVMIISNAPITFREI